MIFLKKIKNLWVELTGAPGSFSLEVRIFHSICIISLLTLVYDVFFNLAIGLPMVSVVSLIILLPFACFYYLSRFKNKVQTSIVICCALGNILYIANYFSNSGLNGPSDVSSALSLLLIISVTPKKQHKIWVSLNVIILLLLHVTEYYYPHLVPNTYPDRASRFVDASSAYLVFVILMYYTITYIRRNYDHEKRSAEGKAHAIEQKNQHILVQNLELERLNADKNKLMSIIAHDLRAPLGNIQNYLELLDEYDLDSDERRLIENDLLKHTKNTTQMLSKLLSWSKAQMDGVTVELKGLGLLETLQSTLEIEKAIAHKKDISLTYQIDDHIKVIADSDMLQMVVRNLLNNAIKFTPFGGDIYVEANLVGNECQLMVKDNGTGIAVEQQNDMFSLNAKSTFGTDNEKGVGLGLLLCKEFTELQDGRIWLDSVPGNGSTFFVSLPLYS